MSFELPEKWQCKIEGTEWVCSSTFKSQAREAIIILTAKEAGPNDNMAAYEEHLKQSRLIPSREGSPSQSKVLHVKRRRIGQQEWVEGMHTGSEIPNYYTKYLASAKERVAILVTFSAHVQHYTKYSSDFFRAIQSLRVVANKSLISHSDSPPLTPPSEVIGVRTNDLPNIPDDELPDEATGPKGGGSKAIGGSLLGLSAILYFFFRKKGSKLKLFPKKKK